MKVLIIPAAGQATRLRPISNNTSKCMISINGKPIIDYIIKQSKQYYDKIIIVHGKNYDVKDYCTLVYNDLDIEYVEQSRTLGPLHAIYLGLEIVEDIDKLTIWLGDTIITDYVPNFDNYELVVGQVNDWSRWCLINHDGRIFDKPEVYPDTNLALAGIYTFNNGQKAKDIITYIIEELNEKHKSEFQISSLLIRYKNSPDSIIETNEWYDCGDLPSLYESSARLLEKYSTRPDSKVKVDYDKGTFTKSGDRCTNEVYWYNNINNNIKYFTPRIFSSTNNSYEMELLSGITLQDILLYENLTDDNISYLINKCLKSYELAFMNNDNPIRDKKLSEQYILFEKTRKRLFSYNYDFINNYDMSKMLDYNESLSFKIGDIKSCQYIHGDFHAGNIFVCLENGKIKFIDPRGVDYYNDQTTSGLAVYDLVKFAQSFYGDYIWIYSNMEVNLRLKDIVLHEFEKWLLSNNIDKNIIYQLVPIVMSSCLDFHKDSRQRQIKIWNKSLELINEYSFCKDR
jgi:glucose-1-phosphate thymidylyltransferase